MINWNAIWKIVLAALIGGGGVVIAFGLAQLGLERAKTAGSRGVRLAQRTLAGACGLFCVAALVIGIYAMVEKPSSKSVTKPTSAARSDRQHGTN